MWDNSLPIFRLVDGAGRESGTEPLWQKRDMLVAVLDPENCPACNAAAAALAAAEDEWAELNVGLVMVPLTEKGEVGRVVSSLFDVFAQLGISTGSATLAVADRFGRIYAALDVHDIDPEQLLREARDWLEFAQEQCDECGVPTEPHAETPLADSADDGRG